MTKEEINRVIDLLSNWNGKKGKESNVIWSNGSNDGMLGDDLVYYPLEDILKMCIKSEPKYIPFTFEDRELLIGKIVKLKTGSSISMITHVQKDTIKLGGNDQYSYTYKELYDKYEFLDNIPCGKLAQ